MRYWKVVSVVVIVALASVAWLKRPSARFAKYRYRVGSPATSDAAHVAFLEEKIKTVREPILELNDLAALYAARAKWTGDETYYDRAEATARRSLAITPRGNHAASLVLAEVAQAHHSFDAAIRLGREVLAEAPGTERALTLMTTCELALGNYAEAFRHADRLATARPLPANLALRALVLGSLGRDDESTYDFDRALAVEDFGAPRESAWVRAVYGRLLLRQGKVAHARSALKEAVRIFPQSHFALSLLGEAAAASDDWAEADTYFARAFEISPAARYLRGRAIAVSRLGKTALAADLRTQAEKIVRTELARGRLGHRLDLVPLLLDKGDAESVKEALALAEEEAKSRKSHDALYWLGAARLQSKQTESARETVRELLLQGENRAEFFDLAARVEAASGNQRRATFYIKKARDTNPKASIPGQELGVSAAVG